MSNFFKSRLLNSSSINSLKFYDPAIGENIMKASKKLMGAITDKYFKEAMDQTFNYHTAQLICFNGDIRIVHNVDNPNKYIIWQSRLFERVEDTNIYVETDKVQRIRTFEGDEE